MKTIKQTLIFIACINAFGALAQDYVKTPTTVVGLSSTFDNYLKDAEDNLSESKSKELAKLKKQRGPGLAAHPNLTARIEEIKLLPYNPKMLNMFIANNISTYLTSSKDLSLQEYYAILESADGSLFIGYNIANRENKIDRLKSVFNIGLKSHVENNFSNLITKGKLSPELGVNLKYTYIFRGTINFEPTHKDVINDYRTNYLKDKYKETLDKYKDSGAKSDENTELEAKIKYIKPDTKKTEELIAKEYIAQYEKIATDEETFINDNKLFNSVDAYWLTVEAYVPLTEKEYQIATSESIFETTPARFYNFNSNLSATAMRRWSDKKTFYGTFSIGVFNNNNIVTKALKKYTFETVAIQDPSHQTVTDTKEAYVGTFYKEFSQSMKLELIGFFVKDITGLSASVEQTFGKLDSKNWKLGIPISLKDKDKKPTINFEFQWKEVYKEHFIGISVGYAFGKFLK